MERFVIGAAIFAAVAIAAGGYFGHAVSDGDGFRFEINTDESGGAAAPAAGTGQAATAAAKSYAAHELRIRNAVATLKVIPEDRTDISIEIANPGRLKMPAVRVVGDELVVDGGISSRRIHGCNSSATGLSVDVRGIGDVSSAQAPVITARVPRAVNLEASGAVMTAVGPSASADLGFNGCGDVTVADVAGRLKLESNGSGDVIASAAQSADISSAGSGDTQLGAVAGKLEIALAGSGSVTALSGAGPLDVSIAGSGDVAINGGAMQDAEISIAGSGGVTVAGSVQALNVSIAGSGDVDVAGAATSVDANIMGSGDVTVGSASGTVEKAVMGSGTVTVGASPTK